MRYECTRSDGPTKFWQYKLKSITGRTWEVFVQYGLIDLEGDDQPLVHWNCVCSGTREHCRRVIKARVRERLALGYLPV